MPIYEYQCPACGHVFEEWVNITSASDEAPCPQCGQQATHILSNTAFVLKGGGWYVTDYGSRKNDGHKEGQDSGSAAVPPAAVSSDSTAGAGAASQAAPAPVAAPAPTPAPAAAPTAPPTGA